MIDSILISASGLLGHEEALKLISNNVANMNTVGFKGAQSEFKDIFLNSAGVGAEGSGAGGGGLETLPSSIRFGAGTIQNTGNSLDAALTGPGFFVLQGTDGKSLYTKDGHFQFNSSGVLQSIDAGYDVMALSGSKTLVPLSIDSLKVSQPQKSTQIVLTGNFSSSGTTASVSSVNAYDSEGGTHSLDLAFSAVGTTDPGAWAVTVTENGATLATGTVKVTGTGPDPTADRVTIPLHAADGSVTNVDMMLGSDVTGFSSGTTSTVSVKTVDGHAAGQISTMTFDTTGTLSITYTNGQTAKGPQLALAEFASPDVLHQESGALFSYNGTDQVRLTTAGTSTQLTPQSLELSNVDMTDQFSNLILIQRGYQASSQVLTTANEMIQDLFNMRTGK